MSTSALQWHDAETAEKEGQGWADTAHPYDRLPARADGMVPEHVYRLGREAPDLLLHFETDAEAIHTRAAMRPPLREAHLYRRYLDLYARDAQGAWRWAGVSDRGFVPSGEATLAKGLAPARRTYRLYLPPFFAVERLAVGVPAGAHFRFLPARRERPVAVYGTSIIHGSSASRPGMIVTGILGRRLAVPVLNLGFSGSARCELAVAKLLAELDPVFYVVDPLPNMSPAQVAANAEPFLRCLHKARPRTPLLLVEDRCHSHEWLHPAQRRTRLEKRAAFRAAGESLAAAGAPVRYVEGDGLLGGDSERTVDGSHPSDLGYAGMADVLEPVWRSLLTTQPPLPNERTRP